MKILHTSDWHIGHILYNHKRVEEQGSMLLQMVKIVKEEQPDVFLLCGDIFHTSQPSPDDQTMLTEAINEIHLACKHMVIVAIAGNHDSGKRHEIFRTPWQTLNVNMIGQIEINNLDKHIIRVADKGFVIAVPFYGGRDLTREFYQQLIGKVAAMNEQSLPVVVMAHTTVSGCDFMGHDQIVDEIVGGIESVSLSQFGEGYDYLALGHIHREQWVKGSENRVRYCGAPIPVSFDEKYSHSISLVDIEKHGATPVVTKRTIENCHELVTLPTEGFAPWDEVKELLRIFPKDNPAYIRLNVEIDDFLPQDAQMEIARLTEDKACRYCFTNVKRRTKRRAEDRSLTIQEFQVANPIDIVKRYAEDKEVPFDDDLQALFNEALAMVKKDERDN